MPGPYPVPPRGAVDLPGLWTPAQRHAESRGRRSGRPQAAGNLAGDRCRSFLHSGREIHLSEALDLSKQPGPLQSGVEPVSRRRP